MLVKRILVFTFLLLPLFSLFSQNASLYKTGTLWSPFIEWVLPNPTFTKNPYDVVATVTFTHTTSGAKHITEMFYDGQNIWKFRFTATQPGTWQFQTSSIDPDLDGHQGTVTIVDFESDTYGFATQLRTADGTKWARFKGNSGTIEAFVPQLVMYDRDPKAYYNNPNHIEADIREFFDRHGFNGFHVPHVGGRWFNLRGDEVVDSLYQNPDPQTFEALEQLIIKTHAAGGVVHIWPWGDQQRRWTPIELSGGINGEVDQRLQRYIAARLGPLPGWSMGYGFDLNEWVTEEQLHDWRQYMQEHMGWFHYLGGRPAEAIVSWNQGMDYSSYEHHEPDYHVYKTALTSIPEQPVLSEDRLRIRGFAGPKKNYTMEQVRRGLWHSFMAGGVANIWGNLTRPDGTVEPMRLKSHPFPNPEWIKTAMFFFEKRFLNKLVSANFVSEGYVLQNHTKTRFVIYKENTNAIRLNLSEMAGPQPAIAIDTKLDYDEIKIGVLQPAYQIWQAPYSSDWALGIGVFHSVFVDDEVNDETAVSKQSSFLLRQNYPNPFNPETEIRFHLFKSGFVTLAIYDARGRLIRDLVKSEYPPGDHTVKWRGADEKGGLAASGIFYYRLKFGEVIRVKKMLLLR